MKESASSNKDAKKMTLIMEKKLLEVLKMPLIILQHLSPDSATLSEVCCIIQGVRLATEPGISLIILTPMKILQRNSNRSMFIV